MFTRLVVFILLSIAFLFAGSKVFSYLYTVGGNNHRENKNTTIMENTLYLVTETSGDQVELSMDVLTAEEIQTCSITDERYNALTAPAKPAKPVKMSARVKRFIKAKRAFEAMEETVEGGRWEQVDEDGDPIYSRREWDKMEAKVAKLEEKMMDAKEGISELEYVTFLEFAEYGGCLEFYDWVG